MDVREEFLNYLLANNISRNRYLRYKALLFKEISKVFNGDFRNINQSIVRKILAHLWQLPLSINSKITYVKMFKKFLRWLKNNYNVNINIDEIKVKSYETTVSEGDLFTEKEIERLINATDDPRFQFAVMFLYESGCRVGELLNLKVKDVKLNGNFARVEIWQQKVRRKKVIPIVASFPFLRKLLTIHPLGNKPEAPLIYEISNPVNQMKYPNFLKQMKKLFKKANVRWRRLHNFRHTRATLLLRENVNPEIVKKYMGWSDLGMLKHYSHLTYDDVENLMLKKYGIIDENGKEEKPIKCLNCGFLNPPAFRRCGICGYPLRISKEEVEEIEAREKVMMILDEAIKDEKLGKLILETLSKIVLDVDKKRIEKIFATIS